MSRTRVQRGRTADEAPPKPPDPVPTGVRQVQFSIRMAGTGSVGVFDHTPAVDEIARIEFASLVDGRLVVKVADIVVLDARVGSGPASVTGLLFPAGLRVGVMFTNIMEGSAVTGTVYIEPAPPRRDMSHEQACEVLGLPVKHTRADLQKAYRRAAARAHPDHGGSHDAMVAINKAYKALSE